MVVVGGQPFQVAPASKRGRGAGPGVGVPLLPLPPPTSRLTLALKPNRRHLFLGTTLRLSPPSLLSPLRSNRHRPSFAFLVAPPAILDARHSHPTFFFFFNPLRRPCTTTTTTTTPPISSAVAMNALAHARLSAASEGSGCASSLEPRLPNELLRSIFLYCDPATLYLSVRSISHAWKHAVEHELLRHHFAHRHWRVGLRVVRKLPPPSPHRSHAAASVATGDAELDRLSILEREGATEPVDAVSSASQPQSVVHVIPLRFKRYDADNVSLLFDTDADWHAVFRVQQPEDDAEHLDGDRDDSEDSESDDDDDDADHAGATQQRTVTDNRRRIEQAEAKACSARLEADFGIVWRFPDDGQDADASAPDADARADRAKHDDAASWGMPDPENGWLSRFYCSKYDLQQPHQRDQDQDAAKEGKGAASSSSSSQRTLHSTPIAPRVRRHDLHPTLQRSAATLADGDDDDDDDERSAGDLIWSDEGHEYLNLSLSLGMEFFVRRSARANQLLRRLEVEAAAAEAREACKKASKNGRKRWGAGGLADSASASGWATPKEVASPPPSRTTAKLDARLQRLRLRLQQAEGSRLAEASGNDEAEPSSSSRSGKSKATPSSSKLGVAGVGATEMEEWEAPLASGAVTPAVPPFSALAGSRLASVAPSRRGGENMALSASSSASGSRSAKDASRRGRSSMTPRATFCARLCRAELMLPPPPSAAGTGVWKGGDALGRGQVRTAQALDMHNAAEATAVRRAAAALAGLSSPAVWSWSR
ncbi:hypothetical protein ACQY0O_006092 [Thecaphora frezii]